MKNLVFPRIFLHCVALGFIVSGLLLSVGSEVQILSGTPESTAASLFRGLQRFFVPPSPGNFTSVMQKWAYPKCATAHILIVAGEFMPTKANHPTTPHASLFYSPLPQLLRHGEVVFLIPDQPVPLHEGQLVAQRAALHVQVVRQLLAVVGYVEFVAAGALDAL